VASLLWRIYTWWVLRREPRHSTHHQPPHVGWDADIGELETIRIDIQALRKNREV
jgi:hypothetical protein